MQIYIVIMLTKIIMDSKVCESRLTIGRSFLTVRLLNSKTFIQGISRISSESLQKQLYTLAGSPESCWQGRRACWHMNSLAIWLYIHYGLTISSKEQVNKTFDLFVLIICCECNSCGLLPQSIKHSTRRYPSVHF